MNELSEEEKAVTLKALTRYAFTCEAMADAFAQGAHPRVTEGVARLQDQAKLAYAARDKLSPVHWGKIGRTQCGQPGPSTTFRTRIRITCPECLALLAAQHNCAPEALYGPWDKILGT
jgi:hypothetical protein